MTDKKNGRGANLRGKPKIGGRAKGTPNRRTVEAREQQRLAEENKRVVEATVTGPGHHGTVVPLKKLGKDVLEDYVFAFHQVAATYQNRVAQAIGSGSPPAAADLAAFKDWGGLVVNTARALAEFQSPKYKAIMVAAAPPEPQQQQRSSEGNVVEINDAVAMSRVYQRLVKAAK